MTDKELYEAIDKAAPGWINERLPTAAKPTSEAEERLALALYEALNEQTMGRGLTFHAAAGIGRAADFRWVKAVSGTIDLVELARSIMRQTGAR